MKTLKMKEYFRLEEAKSLKTREGMFENRHDHEKALFESLQTCSYMFCFVI